MIKKFKQVLKNYLPMSRREAMQYFEKIEIVIQGITQAEAQHSQIEVNLIQHMNALQAMQTSKNVPDSKRPKNDKQGPMYG